MLRRVAFPLREKRLFHLRIFLSFWEKPAYYGQQLRHRKHLCARTLRIVEPLQK